MVTKPEIPYWKQKARERRQQQVDQIPPAWRLPHIPSPTDHKNAIKIAESCGILTELELEITSPNQTIPSLVEKLRNKTWTSVQVTTAFCKRAAVLHQLTRCLSEILFDDALHRAAELDEILATTGKPVGPLHGLPMSIKDNHEIAGVDSTIGMVGLIGKPAKEDHPAITEYRRLGVVIFTKTNLPQTMMMSDSYNPIFGQTVNPLNRNLIAGGSSGGECSLIRGAGSIIGVGTDLGGSVRIPACLQGLYGMDCSVGRLCNRQSIRSQLYIVAPSSGPLARHLESVEFFYRSFLAGNVWLRDPGMLPIPWREDEYQSVQKKKLKIGYVLDDGVAKPHPPIQRAVKELVDKLARAGHEVFQWDASSSRYANDLWEQSMLCDGGKKVNDWAAILDEDVIPGMVVGNENTFMDYGQRIVLADQVWEFQRDYMRMWEATKVDAIIMPVMQWAGMPPKTWNKSQMYFGYSSFTNVLNWTALAMPVTTVSAELDAPSEEWKAHVPRSFHDKFNHDLYDVNMLEGMPVGVQLITGRCGEEKALGLAKYIQSLE